jgi:hypothetical protein
VRDEGGTARSQRRPKLQTKENQNMNNRDINCRSTFLALLMALAFACLSSSTVQGQNRDERGSIVGLWQEHYTSNFGPQFDTYTQWHRDGLEIETPSFLNGVCMGTWKQIGGRTVQLFHVGWTPGGIPGHPESVRFELRQLNTVSVDQDSFDGTYDQKFFDTDGNQVAEDMGTIHATRLSVNQFADQSGAAAAR